MADKSLWNCLLTLCDMAAIRSNTACTTSFSLHYFISKSFFANYYKTAMKCSEQT